MNFKSIGLKAAVAAAVVAGSTFAVAPSQAATFGSVTFGGQNELKSVKGDKNTHIATIVFNDGVLNINAGSGSFSSFVGGTATFISKTVETNQTNLNNFITFKTADLSKTITFNLTAFLDPAYTEIGSELDFKNPKPDTNGQFQARISGFLNPGASPVDDKNSGFNTFKFDSQVDAFTNVTSIKLATTPIPTPALLPGLIGMGIAAIRKRKSEEIDVEEAETVKA